MSWPKQKSFRKLRGREITGFRHVSIYKWCPLEKKTGITGFRHVSPCINPLKKKTGPRNLAWRPPIRILASSYGVAGELLACDRKVMAQKPRNINLMCHQVAVTCRVCHQFALRWLVCYHVVVMWLVRHQVVIWYFHDTCSSGVEPKPLMCP